VTYPFSCTCSPSILSTMTTVVAIDPAPAYNDAERGTLDITSRLPVATSYPDEKKADLALVAEVIPVKKDTPAPNPKPAAKPAKHKPSAWTRWQVWFNTYRLARTSRCRDNVTHDCCRKFFVFTFSLNMIGLGLAASGHWHYPIHFPGALILGNLQVAILVRNELFGRFLYLTVNTLFAKVRYLCHRSCGMC
jgi:hypothetical protein